MTSPFLKSMEIAVARDRKAKRLFAKCRTKFVGLAWRGGTTHHILLPRSGERRVRNIERNSKLMTIRQTLLEPFLLFL